jgi:hypothetical protein
MAALSTSSTTPNGPYVIRLVGTPHGATTVDGLYVREYDACEGTHGRLVVTDDPAYARAFATRREAIDAYRAVNTTHPGRPGVGGVNRPLTAFSVDVRPLVGALDEYARRPLFGLTHGTFLVERFARLVPLR